MKIRYLVIIACTLLGVLVSNSSYAGPETRCYSYGNANGLAYCLAALQRGGVIRTAGVQQGTARVYSSIVTQQVNQPKPKQRVIVGYTYGPYATTPVSMGASPQGYSPTGQAIAAIGGISANIMNAAAWAYNWRHGYVGARGIYGASYMANYPW